MTEQATRRKEVMKQLTGRWPPALSRIGRGEKDEEEDAGQEPYAAVPDLPPEAPVDVAPEPVPADPEAAAQVITVLVVDDMPDMRKFIASVLRETWQTRMPFLLSCRRMVWTKHVIAHFELE